MTTPTEAQADLAEREAFKRIIGVDAPTDIITKMTGNISTDTVRALWTGWVYHASLANRPVVQGDDRDALFDGWFKSHYGPGNARNSTSKIAWNAAWSNLSVLSTRLGGEKVKLTEHLDAESIRQARDHTIGNLRHAATDTDTLASATAKEVK